MSEGEEEVQTPVDFEMPTAEELKQLFHIDEQGKPRPLCHNHNEVCALRVSKTAENPNRQFYACPRKKSENCGYFKWESEVVSEYSSAPEANAKQLTRMSKIMESFQKNMNSMNQLMAQAEWKYRMRKDDKPSVKNSKFITDPTTGEAKALKPKGGVSKKPVRAK